MRAVVGMNLDSICVVPHGELLGWCSVIADPFRTPLIVNTATTINLRVNGQGHKIIAKSRVRTKNLSLMIDLTIVVFMLTFETSLNIFGLSRYLDYANHINFKTCLYATK